jgi:hypothetical protein
MPTEVQIYKDATIVAADIADDTITATQIADKTITAAKIADTTITAAQIANTTITAVKLSTGGPNWDVNGNLSTIGDITAYSGSDERLKDNITPIPDSLDKVLSISGNTFDWNEKSEKEGNDVGVVAQEILEVLPEAVITRDNGYLAVRYEKIIPLLIEAIKDQQNIILDLKNRIENLENM